jgi:cation transport regulator ChaB
MGTDLPRRAKGGVMPRKETEIPGTLARSPKKAQRTWKETHDSAIETYDGDEERAHRTAYAALKHSYEKVGDHWEEKDEKGPSDPQAAKSGRAARRGGETFGGIDVEGNTKEELYRRAKEAGIEGRSRMTKAELARALARRQG